MVLATTGAARGGEAATQVPIPSHAPHTSWPPTPGDARGSSQPRAGASLGGVRVGLGCRGAAG